jgi:hypothetical protein
VSLGKLKAAPRKKAKDPLLERFETYLELKANKPLPYKQKPGHKPSSLGSDCLRKIYYSYFRTPRDQPITGFLARIFDTGVAYEKMVLDWLIGMGEHIPYINKSNGEIPLDHNGQRNPQFPIKSQEWEIPKGYVDNVAIVDGKLWLYEIKSKKASKFDLLTEPDKDHIVQVTCYFKAFMDHLNAGDYAHVPQLQGYSRVEGIKVIYVNKDNSSLKVFNLAPIELIDSIVALDQKLLELKPYLVDQQLPPPTKTECKYCDFRKKCNKNWNGPF